ncbi:MAG: tRNA (adenosine(37)-N6)-dimethylallyltransferase MiaA [Helcococcus sp.]|nr:tRNA (adenosine(37)-N6)-dimethylallyltransferase MiaA [Helcococcus sp.]
MKDVIIIAGPTAVGKTSLSINLAKKLNTEIISADSMQIYKGMDIGTAKVTKEEMNGIKHHMIDILNPNDNYSVQEFQNSALELITKIHSKGKIPIIVGGTGLYIDSLTHDFDFVNVKPNYELREKLESIYEENPSNLLDKVYEISKESYSHLSLKDKKKLIRAIEIYEDSGKVIDYSRFLKNTENNYHLFVLYDDREKLYERINKRVDMMISNGLIDEVRDILKVAGENAQSMKAIGYREVIPYLKGEIDFETMKIILKQHSRNYAKRQLTWFRRNEYSQWINIEDKTTDEIANFIIKRVNS